MLVQHALRIAGGAAGVAEAARLALVAFVPAHSRRPRRRASVVELGRRSRHNARWSSSCGFSRSTSGCEAVVEEHPVLGMIDDIVELIVEQARVEGVEHPAHADHAEPGDQGDGRGSSPAWRRGRRASRRAAPAPAPAAARRRRSPSSWCGSSVPSARAATISRVAMLALGMIHQPHDPERQILHCAERAHRRLPQRGAHHACKMAGDQSA